ncbi:MAG: lipoprotein-releasing ABC transporter permease subunit [Alphaproteobacteria bacterium]|nr:lipoprotein-releasing ABC transporter permease subunit [Alphaproteobacteria bacterium]
MFGPAERWVARRYLRPTREHGFVSVITVFALTGIALGVGTLIVVLAVMNGFRAELLDRILGLNGHLTVQAGPAGIADYERLTDELMRIEDVREVTPFVEGQAMASANGAASGVLMRGLRPADLRGRTILEQNILRGSLGDVAGGRKLAVGSRLARRMGLRLGDDLTLISPDGPATALGTLPRVVSFEIAAVFEIGMYEYDNGVVFTSLDAAQTYFDLDDRVNAIDAFLADPERLDAAHAAFQRVVGGRYWVTSWRQANAQFFNALEVERNVMFLILTLIILVAAFNIVTGLTMLVRSKGRDIAILRTMGATRGAIMRIFFLAGMTIGTVGTAIGFVLGLAFALNVDAIRRFLERFTGAELWSAEIRFLSQLPAKVETGDVVSVVGMALVLALLATLVPSWRAAQLDPVEALRRE